MQYKEVEIYQTPPEIEILRQEVRNIKDIEGDIAEVGVYQGATACIIREESDKDLYLFDTFEGFSDQLDESDSKKYKVGDCAADESYVKEIMKGKKRVYITKGTFPNTSDSIKNKKFAFVHIDVDIYNATKDSLEFFIPRMSKGGTILIHDYPAHDGVKKAVQELGLEPTIKGTGGRQATIHL